MFASNVLSLLSKPNNKPKLGRSCKSMLGAVVGGSRTCCVIVIVAMVEEVIVSTDIGRGATKEVERDDEKNGEEEGVDDEQESDEEGFIHPSLSTHTEEEPRDEESFNPISKTPKDTDDKGNGEEDLDLNVGREEGHDEEEEEDELYKDVNINQGRGEAVNSARRSLSWLDR
nr:hypothetical protein [Tanacetum cinerariifolium]